MAAALSDAQLQAVQQQLSAHPEILKAIASDNQLFQHQGRQAYVLKNGAKGPADILKQYGIDFPDAGDYQIQQQPDGSVSLKRQNWFQRNADWILPVATIGTGGIANAAAAPAGGGSAFTDVTPAMNAGAVSSEGTPFVAGTVSADAGTGFSAADAATTIGTKAASTGFGAALNKALPTIIGAGASLGGAAIAAHGNTEAAKIQAASADKALAQAKEIWQQQRADEGPYRALGASALTPLSFGLGIPDPNVTAAQQAAANPPASTGVAAGAKDASGASLPGAAQAPYVVPPTDAQQRTNGMGTLNTVGQGNGPTVNIRDPQTGVVHLVPREQIQQALQAGGVMV